MDIHRKPGYDPVELFLDPAIRAAGADGRLEAGARTLGFRTLLDVIPLDATLVKGSHGRRPAAGELDAPVFMTRRNDLARLVAESDRSTFNRCCCNISNGLIARGVAGRRSVSVARRTSTRRT